MRWWPMSLVVIRPPLNGPAPSAPALRSVFLPEKASEGWTIPHKSVLRGLLAN